MKALIFNSGIGKRMGEMTKNSPKSMVKLLNGETIFERQIRLLSECGIKDIVVTTGPFEEQLIAISKKEAYKDIKFTFVHNDLYDKTNYIYSCYLARKYLDDDFLTLHGDLVFSKSLLQYVLDSKEKSTCLINKALPLPDKDFKGRITDGRLREVSISIFGDDCFTFQPLYKLTKSDMAIWVKSIEEFVAQGNTGVYAENAFNVISDKLNIIPLSYEHYYINEIDNLEDYERVTKDIEQIDYEEQNVVLGIDKLEGILKTYNLHNPLIVVAGFLKDYICTLMEKANVKYAIFTNFSANPRYENVMDAMKVFKDNACDSIVSLGGGSAMDVAKCVKLFLPMDDKEDYLTQKHVYINLKHIAIPTTAGTGSESTRFIVFYKDGIKQSIADDMVLPDVAILEKDFLKSLPLNQKTATMFDALSQAIESMWSVNSTHKSTEYSEKAIKLILNNYQKYLANDESVMQDMMLASNLAGKAINITQTTAAHAMSYKITSHFGIPHGHAVALVLPFVWKYLDDNCDKTFDVRGKEHLRKVLNNINELFGFENTDDSINKYVSIMHEFKMINKLDYDAQLLDNFANSVNPIRLRNFPVALDKDTIQKIYTKIFNANY